MPELTIQVLPTIAHPANAGEFVVADDSAWCEHVAGGFAYSDQTVRKLDVGYSDSISGRIRRAVLLRDKRCAWPQSGRPAVYPRAKLTAVLD